MELNIPEPAKKKATIYGQQLELSEPSVDQIIELTEKTSGLPPQKQLPELKKMAIGLGIPEELAGRMRFADFTALIEGLTGSKKK